MGKACEYEQPIHILRVPSQWSASCSLKHQGDVCRKAGCARSSIALSWSAVDTAAVNASAPTEAKKEEKGTIAQYLDKQLENEFRNEELASQKREDFNETLSREKVRHLKTGLSVFLSAVTRPCKCCTVPF